MHLRIKFNIIVYLSIIIDLADTKKGKLVFLLLHFDKNFKNDFFFWHYTSEKILDRKKTDDQALNCNMDL